jgi:hypothetical protein
MAVSSKLVPSFITYIPLPEKCRWGFSIRVVDAQIFLKEGDVIMAAEKKNKGGRPVKCTPEQVAQAVDELINDYIEEGTMPTDYRLMKKIGV